MQIVGEPFIDGAITSAIMPILVALIAAGALRLVVGPRLTGLAIGIGFLAAYLGILGLPPYPPVASTQKIFYLVLTGSVLGAGLDIVAERTKLARVALLVWPTVIAAWIGWRVITSPSFDGLVKLVPLWLAGIFIFDRLAANRDRALVAPSMLLVAAIGASAVALIGASGVLSQFAAATAAAVAGYLLWNWPRQRDVIGWSALFAGGSAFYAVAAVLVLFSRSNTISLLFILAVFALGFLYTTLPPARRPVLGPLVVGALLAVPAIAAIAVAALTASGAA